MKKVWVLMIAGMLSISFVGCTDPCKENVLTQIGDAVATLGKKGLEKDQVLAGRKADRMAACAQKTGSDMKKSLGF
ncbi:MAG: hypothetical protein H6757_07340 [Candidatus Omnitrophica bacterium]|nr:hypothetical protein [Candidatus Omnitrophota bacterium]